MQPGNKPESRGSQQRSVLRDGAFALLVTAGYLGFKYEIVGLIFRLGLEAGSDPSGWNEKATYRWLVVFVGNLVCLVLVGSWALLHPDGALFQALRPGSVRRSLKVAAWSVVLFICLAGLHLWPWTWQWPPNTALIVAKSLETGGQYIALLYWYLSNCLIVPVVEEVGFRFGVVRTIVGIGGSPALAIAASAILFGVAHLGGTLHPDRAHLVNSAWMLVFGGVTAAMFVRNSWELDTPIAAHVCRNTVEFVALLHSLSA